MASFLGGQEAELPPFIASNTNLYFGRCEAERRIILGGGVSFGRLVKTRGSEYGLTGSSNLGVPHGDEVE